MRSSAVIDRRYNGLTDQVRVEGKRNDAGDAFRLEFLYEVRACTLTVPTLTPRAEANRAPASMFVAQLRAKERQNRTRRHSAAVTEPILFAS